MTRLVEAYYTVPQLEVLLQRCGKTLRERIKSGDFGRAVVLDGGDYLVPASGVNAWLDSKRLFNELDPVLARSPGEALRKATV